MRDGWKQTSLRDLLDPLDDRAGKRGDFTVLSVTEKRGIIPQSEVFNHRVATNDVSKYKVLTPGDIAYNPYLLWCGAIGQWNGETRGVVSPVYECFRARETEHPRFVGLLLESGLLTPYFDSTAIGSIKRRRRTTQTVFLDAPAARPPFEGQRRIVDVVSSVDTYIDTLQRQTDVARDARNAVLHELLSTGGDDWTETTLGKVAIVNPRVGALSEDSPFVPMDAVHVGKRFVVYFEPRGQRAGARALGGDVLFARITPCLENGKVAQLPHEVGPCGGSTEFIVIRGSESMTSDFAYFWASWESTRNTAAGLMTGTTGRQRLSWQDLSGIELNLPPIEQQQRIIEIVSSMDEVIQSSEQAVSDAKSLRSGLLSDLLSGEHEIPESYDRFLRAA